MLHVLVDMHRLKHNPYNGLYVFSKELGNALAAHQPADTQLHFYVPPEHRGAFGAEVDYLRHRSVDKFFRMGTGKFDVWHITTTLSYYKPFSQKVKVVYTIHDLNFLIEDRDNLRRNKRLLGEIRKRAARADCIVGISQFALNAAREHLSVEGKEQRVIYNGAAAPPPAGSTPAYVPRRPFLFSIGQMYRRKNFHVLPALLPGTDYELVIAGLHQTDYGHRIEEAARRHGVRDRLHLVGPVTEAEKHWYYGRCDAFLFPSLAEGFGLPVVEAMQYGKPVFLSTATCLPEIGGDAAYYFDSFERNAMRNVFAEGMARHAQPGAVEKTRQRAAGFGWPNAAKQYLDLYRCLTQ